MCCMIRCVLWLLMLQTVIIDRAGAQEQEIQQLLLNVEKLAQLKSILNDLEKGYEIVANGYSSIKEISEGGFNLHEAFLQGLLRVSPAVKKYWRVADIIHAQYQILKDYKDAQRQFSTSNLLHAGELLHIKNVYAQLVRQSVNGLEELSLVLSNGTLRMTDDERLSAIDAVWEKLNGQRAFLRRFNDQSKWLLQQRAREMSDINTQKRFFSIH